MLLLLLNNLALNIVTLGFYRFWARTRLRRYLWGNVELLGDPFVYSGTGTELFKGFLVALAVLVPLGTLSVAIKFIPDPSINEGVKFLFFILVLYLIFFAIFSARRYRLSRSMWRGVRFGLSGKAADYAKRKLLWTLLMLISLGFASPWLMVKEQKYLAERVSFGDRHFSFDGRGGDLLWSWLLVYLTLGLGYPWFLVRRFRYIVNQTSLGEAHFGSTVRFLPILERLVAMAGISIFLPLIILAPIAALLYVLKGALPTNIWDFFASGVPALILFAVIALLFASIGQLLTSPILYIPILRHICATLSISNATSLDSIAQSAQSLPATGEGLADAFDVGLT